MRWSARVQRRHAARRQYAAVSCSGGSWRRRGALAVGRMVRGSQRSSPALGEDWAARSRDEVRGNGLGTDWRGWREGESCEVYGGEIVISLLSLPESAHVSFRSPKFFCCAAPGGTGGITDEETWRAACGSTAREQVAGREESLPGTSARRGRAEGGGDGAELYSPRYRRLLANAGRLTRAARGLCSPARCAMPVCPLARGVLPLMQSAGGGPGSQRRAGPARGRELAESSQKALVWVRYLGTWVPRLFLPTFCLSTPLIPPKLQFSGVPTLRR